MSAELFDLLNNEVQARDWTEEQKEMDEMCRLYEGELPARYRKFFPKNTPEHLVQVIPLAWDDLATQAGRLPDLRGEPRNMNQSELKAVGLLEKIGFNYLRQAKPTGKVFMRNLAWWLQLGRAVAIVTPDFEKQMPRFELRDPRTCYPGIAESASNMIVALDDLLFKYELDIEEARARGLANPKNPNAYGRDEAVQAQITIIEYIDKDKWCLVSEHGQSQIAYHGLGMVPGHVFQSYTPDKRAGHNRFRDQLTLAVAISRLITAKMAFADRVTSSTLWTRNYEGMVEIGPDTIIRLGPQGEIGQIGPPQTLQVDQDIQLLNQFSRVLNRNPEVRQGEIAAKGQYTSAKTLEQLSEAIDTVVGGDWDVIGPGMEQMFTIGFEMDVLLWPNVERTISGVKNGAHFLDSYTPSKNLVDRPGLRVDYGFGVGGYQGFLMHLQAGEAGYMSRRRVMESMPGVTDTAEEQNLIDLEAMDDAGKALFQQQAATGALDMRIWAKLRKEMAEKGTPLYEAIEKYQAELAAQAMAAAQQGDTGPAMTVPGEEDMPPQEELPGIPPSVLAGV
jgi:hypothetical protein